MPITTDPTTDIGLVRLRINDLVDATALFSDAQITAFILAEGDTWRASAAAIERIALDQALLLKVAKILPMSVDGAKLAEALLKIAKAYRDRASAADNATGALWDFAEQVLTPWSVEYLVWSDLVRNG